jgi:3-hydroxybutyryl-CoA dehydrogenase
MSALNLQGTPVLVVGAGIMGAGIAQVAAHSGHPVWLFDMREGAAAQAKEKMASALQGLVAKGRMPPEDVTTLLARITPARQLNEAASAGLVVEAIVEDPAAKRSLFQQLEAVVSEACVLATNTSSISITAIANGLQRPARLVGMHFFNPVPLMKLVEVVWGLATAPEAAQAIFELSRHWNKVPVHAKSTPGFIVNRIARPYYAETLALLHEQAATPLVLDSCLKAVGFRMGPCELMDLVGHDTNFAVTRSVFEANFFDKRYQPSALQREMVEGGLLGRKSGQGFYRYPEGLPSLPVAVHEAPHTAGAFTVHGRGPVADQLEHAATVALAPQGWGPSRELDSTWVGVEIDGRHLVQTDGRCAFERAAELGTLEVAVFDQLLQLPAAPGTALAYALPEGASEGWMQQAPAWLAALGFAPQRLSDAPGLVVARTVAMLINEASDAVLQGVCTPEGANAAMKLGVSYPAGPFEWLERWGVANVRAVLRALDAHYRGERYRISPGLLRR